MTKRILIILVLAQISLWVKAQEETTQSKERPRVGVVLSGGGAKGIAHVGVLRVLERAGIPVDIITGTSMGSIVGGLYATGYSADQLDSIVRKQDWLTLLSDKEDPNLQTLISREKESTYIYTKHFTLGKKDVGNMGLLRGRNVSNLLEQLLGRDSIDFNTLPIPFACVATDIVDNTEYDFHSGQLAQAIRASMAIPAAFSPVRLGDHLLVDGGLRNNYPADLAREMGADIIIGVSVQGEAKTADEIIAGGSVLNQLVDVNCKNKYDDNWAMTDVKMRVNVKGYGTLSFNAAAIDTLMRRGEEEAMRHWDELMAVKEKIGNVVVPARHATPNVSAPQFNTETPDPSFSLGVRFDTEERVALQGNLNVPLKTKTKARPDLDFTLRLGKRIMARAEIAAHHREGIKNKPSLLLSSFAYTYRRDEINMYDKGDKAFNFSYDQHIGEFSLIKFGIRDFTFDIGARFDCYDFHSLLVKRVSKYDDLSIGNETFISYCAKLAYNTENSLTFPTRGASFRAKYVYHTDNFAQLDGGEGLSDISASWRINIPVTRHFSFQPTVYGRMLIGDERPIYFGNMIGGEWFGHYVEQQMPFVGIGHMTYTDPYFFAAQLQAQECIKSKHYISLRAAAAQHARKLNEIFDHTTMLGFQLAYAFRTPFGPVGASIGYSNHTEKVNLFLNLGFEF